MSSKRPIAVTMGDPAGIGPEIVVKAFAAEPERSMVVIGDLGVLERAALSTGSAVKLVAVNSPSEVTATPGVMHVIAVSDLGPDVRIGKVDASCGKAAHEYVLLGAELASRGEVSALVTAPINKEALHAAGCPHPGHTEILADHAGVERIAMMLATPELRVVLASIHVSLRDAISMLNVDREIETIQLAHEAGRRLGIEKPRVAVAALNPHAGENGLFGDEEATVIAPAIEQARKAGVDATGPWAADTVFLRAREGEFDAVVCQYHDQGLIPVKYFGLQDGVNITLGLPYVRTSVDHGTAFDIAGTGLADHRSLLTALLMADQLAAVAAEGVLS